MDDLEFRDRRREVAAAIPSIERHYHLSQAVHSAVDYGVGARFTNEQIADLVIEALARESAAYFKAAVKALEDAPHPYVMTRDEPEPSHE